jgi:hypothetical protein
MRRRLVLRTVENVAVSPSDIAPFTWPRWAPVVFSTITTVAVLLTLGAVGLSGYHLALAVLIVALSWTSCVFDPTGRWPVGKAVVLVVACASHRPHLRQARSQG